MALIKCGECGKEISDKAQSCPSCGAPQKGVSAAEPAAASSSGSLLLKSVLFIGIAGGVVFLGTQGYLDEGFPACDSGRAKREFTSAFESSAYALQNSLKVVDVREVSHVSESQDPPALNCRANFLLNNGENARFDFKFTNSESGDEFILEGRPIIEAGSGVDLKELEALASGLDDLAKALDSIGSESEGEADEVPVDAPEDASATVILELVGTGSRGCGTQADCIFEQEGTDVYFTAGRADDDPIGIIMNACGEALCRITAEVDMRENDEGGHIERIISAQPM